MPITKMAYTASDAVLAAGTQTQWKIKGELTYRLLPGMTAIGQVGEKAPTADQTTLEDLSKRFIGGLFEGPDKELKGNFYADDTDQQAFITAAQQLKIIQIVHIWPDNVTAEYEVATLGYFRDETKGEDKISWVVPAKQNGKTIWGKITV